MNAFLLEETVSIPQVSSCQRATAAFEALAREARPRPWLTVRDREDVLVDAKAVDERARADGQLPLAGALVAVPDVPLLVQRLVRDGAVVFGTVDLGAVAGAPPLDLVDAVVCPAVPDEYTGAVALWPTRGLVPALAGICVLARDLDVGQRTLAAMTGPDESDAACREWPADVRFSAGEHPRVVMPVTADLDGVPGEVRRVFAATVDTLRAAGAVVATVPLGPAVQRWAANPAHMLSGYDALLLPAAGTAPALADILGTLDSAAMVGPYGTAVVTRAFDDQVAIDLVGLLSSCQADTPYPATGIELIVFGAHLRGQPLNSALTDVAARFTGFVETAPCYRMVALPGTPLRAGVLRAGAGGGALLAERWVVSPAGLGRFLAELPAPLSLGSIELAGGVNATGVLCDAVAAAEGTDVTSFGCWRAYLRYLSTRGPIVPGPRPASG
ncbi:amidase [Saccharomonospora sp. NPDC046836]|uniref:allophanate hydrolase-related protein n=1 Tax=Saccharomonospora sp. NPDC046836 TaxID=3156921 RepID=UPI003407CA6B